MNRARYAAVCSWILGFGFGIPCAYGIWYHAEHGAIWIFLGFPTYGDGPFERIGVPTSVPLLTAYLVVCAGEVLVGCLLWRADSAGPLLGLLLLPVEIAFWVGFALPVGPPLGVARTLLARPLPSRTDRGGISLGKRRAVRRRRER